MTAYETDYHAWAMQQAEALKRRSANEIDWDNLAEEVEDLGKSQVKELRSRLTVLLTHLLKWAHQPGFRSRSWTATITLQRRALKEHLEDNPSLKSQLPDAFAHAYDFARRQAGIETGLASETFPSEPPFALEESLTESWLPEGDDGTVHRST